MDIYLGAMTVAAGWRLAAWLNAVFSYLVAMALTSLVFAKQFRDQVPPLASAFVVGACTLSVRPGWDGRPMRIRTILTDKGKAFTDRLFGLRKRAATGEHAFDTLCASLEIQHRLTPPKSPQTNGMVERFNGRVEEVLQSHHFRFGEELATTLHRYVWLYNQQPPQSALGSKTPLQAMKDWHKLKPELFKKQPNYLPGCDT